MQPTPLNNDVPQSDLAPTLDPESPVTPTPLQRDISDLLNSDPTPPSEQTAGIRIGTFDAPSPNDATVVPSDPSQPFKLPIQPPNKNRKGLIAIIAAVVIVLGLSGGAAALYLVPNLTKKATPAAAHEAAVVVPKGWKKFSTKKFGLSFVTPEKWSVNEFDPQALNTGANGVYGDHVSIYIPENHSGTIDMNITKSKLKEATDQYKTGSPDDGYKTTTKSLKWKNYDAVELTVVHSSNNRADTSYYVLFVQIGDYVFTFPKKNDLPPGMDEKYVSMAEYNQFVDSIRVDKTVVDAQAKEDGKPIVLKTGKDVNLGTVVVPAGWKKVTSKYGITYAAPNAWVETSQTDGLSGGAVCFITVETFAGLNDLEHKGYATLSVYSSDLDAITNQSAYMAGAFGGGVSSVTEKLKWNGYDARRIVATAGGKTQTTLYVRVGNFTYGIPDANDTSTNPFGTKVDATTARTYVNSIRITPVK